MESRIPAAHTAYLPPAPTAAPTLSAGRAPPSCRRHLAAAILPPPSCRRHLAAAILPPPSCRRHLAAAILPPPSCRRHLAAAILPPPSASTSAAAARRDPTQPPRPPPHPIGSVACSGPRPHRRAAQPPRKDFHGLRIWVRLAVSSGSGSQEDTIKLSARAAALSRLQNPLSNSLPLLRAGLRSSLAVGWRHHFLSTSTSWVNNSEALVFILCCYNREGTGREECGLLEI
ncbi:sterile alpha motif domain-containing protein 1-like isoform X3 [Pan troglodytes]|uniref:sterile alpha motif domain-containing protein 1-like isoform X3 n=1 Tax=Pan troglodytes TaxID=9598 RepID=UPI00301347DF